MIDEELVKGLKVLGFSETEAKVYIFLLIHPGHNGTQISKELGISRTATYNALENLSKNNIIKLIPSDEIKNYKVFRPSIILQDKKIYIEEIIKNLDYNLEKLYNQYNFEDIYNIEKKDNIIYKILEMLDNCEKKLIISGKLLYENLEKKIFNIKDDVEYIRINEEDEELIILVDDNELLIKSVNSIYTRNEIIIKQILKKIKLEMEKK